METHRAAANPEPTEDLSMPSWREVFLYFLMLGFVIIGAGIIKLGRASITTVFLAVLLVVAFTAMYFARINFLLIMIAAGFFNYLFTDGWMWLRRRASFFRLTLPLGLGALMTTLPFL